MSNVLIVVDADNGKIKSSSLPGVTAGQQIAAATGGELHLLLMGGAVADAAGAIAAEGYGAKTVHTVEHAELSPMTAEAWCDALVGAVKAVGPAVVGGTATSSMRDVLPRAAAILEAPLVAEITTVAGGNVFTREVSSGRAIAQMTAEGGTVCFTARASDFEPAAAGGAAASVNNVAVAEISTRGVEVVGLEQTKSARPALTEADVVVSGGRGMQKGENFAQLEELTDLLGGALGASRAATDAGMVPADLQVGQTGKVVAPNLYFAVAISGAIQHLAGMKGSKTIVAINKDPEAPIFSVADYGLVAKWEDTLPKLIDLVKARKAAG